MFALLDSFLVYPMLFLLNNSVYVQCYHDIFRGSLVTRWEAPGEIGSSSGGWPTILLQYSDAVGWVFDL